MIVNTLLRHLYLSTATGEDVTSFVQNISMLEGILTALVPVILAVYAKNVTTMEKKQDSKIASVMDKITLVEKSFNDRIENILEKYNSLVTDMTRVEFRLNKLDDVERRVVSVEQKTNQVITMESESHRISGEIFSTLISTLDRHTSITIDELHDLRESLTRHNKIPHDILANIYSRL